MHEDQAPLSIGTEYCTLKRCILLCFPMGRPFTKKTICSYFYPTDLKHQNKSKTSHSGTPCTLICSVFKSADFLDSDISDKQAATTV
jgi:hypothetical protein